jgi:hypothetical protein
MAVEFSRFFYLVRGQSRARLIEKGLDPGYQIYRMSESEKGVVKIYGSGQLKIKTEQQKILAEYCFKKIFACLILVESMAFP